MAATEPLDVCLKKETEKLYNDYTRSFDQLADLYFGDPSSLEKYTEMTSDPYLRLVKREPLWEALLGYNEELGAPQAALDNVHSLRRDGNYVVLAWQHPYLLGGPIETFLKVLTAVLLCRKLNQTGEGNFIPVLWAETDFHDLTEVNRVHLPRGESLATDKLDVDEAERPSLHVPTGEAYEALVDRLEQLLPATEHTAWLLSTLRETGGRNLGDHFAQLMSRVFGDHGLVIAAPHVLRQRSAELIGRAIQNSSQVESLLSAAKQGLEERGYGCYFWDNPLDLFYVEGGVHQRLRYQDDTYRNESTGAEISPSDLAAELSKHPERYSTGVMLSPMAQNFALPCVAQIAGAGGVAFFALQKSLFDTLYVAFPQICPQISATFVDAAADKGLQALGEGLAELLTPQEASGLEEKPDHGAILSGLRQDVVKAVEAYRHTEKDIAGKIAAATREAKAGVLSALGRIATRLPVGEVRAKAAGALKRFEQKAAGVSSDVADELEALRTELGDALREHVEAPALNGALDALKQAAEALEKAGQIHVDETVDAFFAGLDRRLDKLGRDAIAAAERAASEGAGGAESARTVLAPNSWLQEDTIALPWLLNQRGPGVVDAALDALDPFEFRHQVLYLDR
jgi:bacillithiol biosynthesis cysteine-adding enzyme BshC